LILAAATTNVSASRKAQNLAKRFVTHGESFFTFIMSPEIEPANNIAERAVRFVTIDRRVTQGDAANVIPTLPISRTVPKYLGSYPIPD